MMLTTIPWNISWKLLLLLPQTSRDILNSCLAHFLCCLSIDTHLAQVIHTVTRKALSCTAIQFYRDTSFSLCPLQCFTMPFSPSSIFLHDIISFLSLSSRKVNLQLSLTENSLQLVSIYRMLDSLKKRNILKKKWYLIQMHCYNEKFWKRIDALHCKKSLVNCHDALYLLSYSDLECKLV